MTITKQLIAIGMLICMAYATALGQTTLYWTGNTDTTWNDAGNWSVTPGGSSASVPSSADTVIFADSAINHCVLDVNASVAELLISATANKDFDLNGYDLTVAGDFTQYTAIFDGDNGTVTIGGLLHIIGGDFRATTGTTNVADGIIEEGLYFHPNGGKVRVTGTGATIDVATFFYDLEIASGASAELANSIQVANNLDLNGPLDADINGIVLGNDAPGAITGTNGVYFNIGAGPIGLLIWLIGENTGTYTLPFLATTSGPVIPVEVDITTAGDGPDGFLLFSSLELDEYKPQDLLGDGIGFYDATGGNNADYNINRLWLMIASDYTESPVFDLELSYATADLSGISVTEANLKAQAYDELHWGELLGTVNTTANTLAVTGYTLPTDDRANFVALVDNTSPNKSTYGGKTGLTCADAIELDSTLNTLEYDFTGDLWFKLPEGETELNVSLQLLDGPDFFDNDIVLYSSTCGSLVAYDTIVTPASDSATVVFKRFTQLDSTESYYIKMADFGSSNPLVKVKTRFGNYFSTDTSYMVVLIADSTLIPTDTVISSKKRFYFNEPNLTTIARDNNFVSFERWIPLADSFDHPVVDTLKRYYLIGYRSHEYELLTEIMLSATSFFETYYYKIMVEPTSVPNDPLYSTDQASGFDMMNLAQAWNLTKGSSDIRIAIIEAAAFNSSHEDIAGKIRNSASDYDFTLGSVFARNKIGHGTGVAGLAAGNTNNSLGIASAGYNSSLLLYSLDYNSDGIPNTSDLFTKAALDGANIINCSFSYRECEMPQDLQHTINLIHDEGVVIVASAGNGPDNNDCKGGPSVGAPYLGVYYNKYRYPASFEHVISVTSVSDTNTYWYRYDHFVETATLNDLVDIAALGFNVRIPDDNNYYFKNKGTSYATPIVSGIIALMLSVNPCLTPDQVEEIIKAKAIAVNTRAEDLPIFDNGYGGAGTIDAHASLLGVYTYFNQDVTSNTTWSTPRLLAGSVFVKNGATLTITADISAGRQVSIVVERGGKLIIDGGSISACSDTWNGIEVYGDNSIAHPSYASVISGSYPTGSGSEHGVVILKNDAEIKNALIGVLAGRNRHPEYSGGIIIAEDAHFINNETDIDFQKYSEWTIALQNGHYEFVNLKENISEFVDCEFITNSGYQGIPEEPHVILNDVHGVRFYSSNFDDSYHVPFSRKRTGILAFVSSVQAEANIFYKLDRGMDLRTLPSASFYRASISGNSFSNNYAGISTYGPANFSITDNLFYQTDDLYTFGTYLAGSSGLIFENNSFTLAEDGNATAFGVFAAGLGNRAQELLNNEFEGDGEYYAMNALGNNIGLQFKCNDVNDAMDHILIHSGRIRFFQGDCSTPDGPAGNKFYSSCSTSQSHLYSGTGVSQFVYNYPFLTGYIPNLSCVVMNSTFRTNPCASFSTSFSCPGTPDEGAGDVIEDGIYDVRTHIDGLYSNLDGGNRESLVAMAKDPYNSNAALLDSLQSKNGMLSDDVLLAVLYRTNPLDSNDLAGILIENAPHTNQVWREIQELSLGLPGDSITKLESYQSDSTSARHDTMQLIYEYQYQREFDYARLIYISSIDTSLGMGRIMDSLVTETWPNLRLLLADLYLALGEYDDAQDIWDSIEPYNEEVRQHLALREIGKVFADEGYDWTELDSTESEASSFKDDLETIAATNTVAGIEARNILYLLNGEQDTLEYRLKETSSPKMGDEELRADTDVAIAEGSFKLYPNPAMQQLTLELGLSMEDDVSVSFYDLMGKAYIEQNLLDRKAVLDVSGLANGVYIIIVEVNGKAWKQEKLVIMK